jgi:hypothetical protein
MQKLQHNYEINWFDKLTKTLSPSFSVCKYLASSKMSFEVCQRMYRWKIKILQQMLFVYMWHLFLQKQVYKAIYTAFQGDHHTSTNGHIVRSENVGSAWGYLEQLWCKLWEFRFELLTVQYWK